MFNTTFVGVDVLGDPQQTYFGRDIVFSADLCYNEANEKPSSEMPSASGCGGTRQGFPEANEMSFGGSLRSVTEGARVTLKSGETLLQRALLQSPDQ